VVSLHSQSFNIQKGKYTMDWIEIANQIKPDLKKGDIDTCIERVTEELKKLPDTPFHNVINFRFTNKPQDIAEYFATFLQKEKKRIDIKAIYAETNGLDINPEIWYFNLFAYEKYGGHDDYDWLSDWKSDDCESVSLTGLEEIQIIYENFEEGEYEDDYSDARDLCSLLVVLYFHHLIKKAAPLVADLNIPILATSHDYDLIYEYSK
jgi:hypothetical protein